MSARTALSPTPLRGLPALIVALAALTLAGCGDSKDLGSDGAEAKVGEQVSFAAGTANEYLFEDGVAATLKKGAPDREAALAKAASASEYTVRQLSAAQRSAAKDPKLKTLASQLQNAAASIGALTVVLRSGKTPPSSLLSGSKGTIQSVENAARDAGVPVTEKVAANLNGT